MQGVSQHDVLDAAFGMLDATFGMPDAIFGTVERKFEAAFLYARESRCRFAKQGAKRIRVRTDESEACVVSEGKLQG